jgi:4-aminobutyrate aminotransferase
MWVWDKEGKKYLDMTSGIGVLSCGHSHPKVVQAIRDQAGTLAHAQQSMFYSHTKHDELIEKLLHVSPKAGPLSLAHDAFLFTNSGTESTENAIKIARMATGKPNVIVMNKGFHGRSFATMSWSSSKTNYRSGFQPLLSGAFFCPEFTAEAFDSVLFHQTAPNETCAVMLEPIQGEGGVHRLPAEFLQHLRKRCTEHNIMLVYDEVQSGVGRSGHFWGYESADPVAAEQGLTNPDIIAFAKGIASGYPIGGVSFNKSFTDKMTPNAIGGTYGGSAMGCAAASAVLDVMYEEDLMGNAERQGRKIAEAVAGMPLVKDVRQFGLLAGVDIDERVPVGLLMKKSVEEYNMILHTCGKNAIRVIPSLIINDEEVEMFLEKFHGITSEIADGIDAGTELKANNTF